MDTGSYPGSRDFLTLITVAAVVALAPITAASAATHVVHPDGSGDMETIQAAIEAAVAGDTVLLGDGVFTGAGNRDLRFRGKALTVCSINDDPLRCIIDCEGRAGAPHRGFLFNFASESGSVLQGVTIRNGYALMQAGALLCTGGASPVLKNCVFADNTCEEFGGAILCSGYSSMRLEECTFTGNVSGLEGGAILFNRSSPTLVSCDFTGNAGLTGGGVNCYRDCAATLVDCNFENNTASYGGGMFSFDSTPTITRCRFVGNSCSADGGGFISLDSSPIFSECDFLANTAQEHGGGLFVGGDGLATISHSTLADNSSPRGGALYGQFGAVDLTSCTLAQNRADESGSGIHLAGTSATFERVIVAFGLTTSAVHCEDLESPPVFSCSDIHGNAQGDWTGCIADQAGQAGNLSVDPLFCDLSSLDLALRSDSPCAADNNPACGLIGSLSVGCQVPTSVESPGGTRPSVLVVQNHPNPFNPTTMISYELPEAAVVCLRIFDAAGRAVRTLAHWQYRAAGRHEVRWHGRDDSGLPVAAGVYVYRLQTPRASDAGRMALLK